MWISKWLKGLGSSPSKCFSASIPLVDSFLESSSDVSLFPGSAGWFHSLAGHNVNLIPKEDGRDCCMAAASSLRNGFCIPGEDAGGVFSLLLGTHCQTPNQSMVSDMAFNSQLTPQSKEPVYTESMCDVWAPSLPRHVALFCSTEPLRTGGEPVRMFASKMPPETSSKQQKAYQNHSGSCICANHNVWMEAVAFSDSMGGYVPCGFPAAGSFGEVSGRVGFSMNNRTDWLFRPCVTGSIQSCVCQTGLVLPASIPIYDVLCIE